MSRLRKNQQGFAAIEAVLIVLILVIVAGTGVYVYHANHAADNILATASSESAASATETRSSAPTAATTNTGTLKIPELGIELINIPASLNGLKYAISHGTNGDYYVSASFTTTNLLPLNKLCSASEGPIGALSRVNGIWHQSEDSEGGPLVKQYDGFYLQYSQSQFYCDGVGPGKILQISQDKALDKLAEDSTNIRLL